MKPYTVTMVNHQPHHRAVYLDPVYLLSLLNVVVVSGGD